jgi:plastocyanin
VVIKVDPSLPFDPMSACFVDSSGRSYAMPVLGYSFGATQTGTWVRSGETYRVSVNAATGELNRYYKVTFEDVLLSSLVDPDGDGAYTGVVTFPNEANAAEMAAAGGESVQTLTGRLGLVTGDGMDERTYAVEVSGAPSGAIVNRTTGQPVAGASVSALVAQQAEDGSLFYSSVVPDLAGEPNPQVTGGDGRYGFSASSGVYRLDVRATGYQPYRSGDIDAAALPLAQTIALAPVVAGAPTRTIYITANGFVPAVTAVAPGSVIEFINLDLADHTTTGSSWDSGMLAAGQSFKVKLDAAGVYAFRNAANALHGGLITVAAGAGSEPHIFLPMVKR